MAEIKALGFDMSGTSLISPSSLIGRARRIGCARRPRGRSGRPRRFAPRRKASIAPKRVENLASGVSAKTGQLRSLRANLQPAAAAVLTRLVWHARPIAQWRGGYGVHLRCPRCSSGVVARLATLVAVAPHTLQCLQI